MNNPIKLANETNYRPQAYREDGYVAEKQEETFKSFQDGPKRRKENLEKSNRIAKVQKVLGAVIGTAVLTGAIYSWGNWVSASDENARKAGQAELDAKKQSEEIYQMDKATAEAAYLEEVREENPVLADLMSQAYNDIDSSIEQ